MKVQIRTKVLKEALSLLTGQNVYFSYEEDSTSLRLVSAQDGWAVISQADVPCTVLETTDELERRLPLESFREMIGLISDEKTIDATWPTPKGRLLIRWGKGGGNKAELAMDNEGGPAHLSFNSDGRIVRVASDIARSVANAAICADPSGTRANIQGVGLIASDLGTEIRAMDGFRLYRAIIPTGKLGKNGHSISLHLPANAASLLGKYKSRVTDLDIDANVFRLSSEQDGGVTLLLKVIPFQDTHLDPTAMINGWANIKGGVDLEIGVPEFVTSVRRAGLFANKSKAILIEWHTGELVVKSWQSDTGGSVNHLTQEDLTSESLCLLNSTLLLPMLDRIPKNNGMKGEDLKPNTISVHLHGRSACTFSWGTEMYLLLPMSPKDAEDAAKAEEEEGANDEEAE